MIDAAQIAARFDEAGELTIGVEEELMLLDPETLDLAPAIAAALELVGEDDRFKRELPASQIEIVTAPSAKVGDAVAQLAQARLDLAERLGAKLSVAASGTHPFAAPVGELNRSEHYDAVAGRFGDVARRQQVFALQVHVAPGSADAALAVYNALRGYLPELVALAANSPFHGGGDTGFASWRARIAELLPRQGVPPAISDWGDFAAQLGWGMKTGALSAPGGWWWELRPHPALGTLELRVPDVQTALPQTAGVLALAHCLVGWLVERHEAGEALPAPPTWRVAENRWFAVRDGLDATLGDLETGETYRARDRVARLVAELGHTAGRLSCSDELAEVEGLLHESGAEQQRRVEAEVGIAGLVAWMRDEFTRGCAA